MGPFSGRNFVTCFDGGWDWNDFRAPSVGWFGGLAAILALVEESGSWSDLLLASKIVTGYGPQSD